MAVLKARPHYRIVGDLTVRDGDGLLRPFTTGDELPDEIAAALSKGEIDSMLGVGKLQVIGAAPPPKAKVEPPRPLSVEETLRMTDAWLDVSVVDGRVAGGPRGWSITVIEGAAKPGDLKRLADVHDQVPVVVHAVDGQPVATLPLMKLATLLASYSGAR